jgi:hypothetical protein
VHGAVEAHVLPVGVAGDIRVLEDVVQRRVELLQVRAATAGGLDTVERAVPGRVRVGPDRVERARSSVALFWALATLTNEMPIVALIVAFEVVSNVTYAPTLVPLVDDEPARRCRR